MTALFQPNKEQPVFFVRVSMVFLAAICLIAASDAGANEAGLRIINSTQLVSSLESAFVDDKGRLIRSQLIALGERDKASYESLLRTAFILGSDDGERRYLNERIQRFVKLAKELNLAPPAMISYYNENVVTGVQFPVGVVVVVERMAQITQSGWEKAYAKIEGRE